MPTPDEFVAGYLVLAERLQNDAVNAAVAAWRGLGSYRDDDVARFKRLVVPVIQGQQARMAAVTAAFHVQVGRERGDDVPMALMERSAIESPRGVPADVLYQRPASTLYAELAAGTPFSAAVDRGAQRLRQIVSTDMQVVKTRQSDYTFRNAGFTYYRRTLTGTEDCALCVIASTQRYRVGTLLPIHPGCNCGVDKVDAGWDPGQVIDPATLDTTHGKVAEFTGVADRGGRNPDYRELIVTHENGEYGPSLTWRSDNFTGPSDL